MPSSKNKSKVDVISSDSLSQNTSQTVVVENNDAQRQEIMINPEYLWDANYQMDLEPNFISLRGDEEPEHLTRNHVDALSQDPYGRFFSHRHVASAFVFNGIDGKLHAWQWDISHGKNVRFHTLDSISTVEQQDSTKYYGTCDGDTFFANRYTTIRIRLNNDEVREGKIIYFAKAPTEINGEIRKPFWGDNTPLQRFVSSDVTVSEYSKSQQVELDLKSIEYREANPKRRPDQNGVMGQSATEALEDFFTENQELLTPELQNKMLQSIHADLKNRKQRPTRDEWLHGIAHSLAPVDFTKKTATKESDVFEPQSSENLGAAPAYTNTQMMVLERLAKWFKVIFEESSVSINFVFDMLGSSDIINHILYSVIVELDDGKIELEHAIDPFVKSQIYWDRSDAAQTVAVALALLKNISPDCSLDIDNSNTIDEDQLDNSYSDSEESSYTESEEYIKPSKRGSLSTLGIFHKSLTKEVETSDHRDTNQPC